MKTKSEILKLLGGIPEDVYNTICSSFFQEANEKVAQMSTAIEKSDCISIAQLAHAIKGSAGNLYLENISEAAKSIETAAKTNNLTQIQQLFQILKSALNEFQT